MNTLSIQQAADLEPFIESLPPVEVRTEHYIGGGVYERQIFLPAGALLTGKIHLQEHLAKLVSGTMRIWGQNDFGIFTGPMTFVSQPGAKRVGYAETDAVFSTFHYVGEMTDIDEIERALVVDTLEQYLEFNGGAQCHLSQQ